MGSEKKFTGKSALYSKFRPSYPQSLLQYLYTDIGFQQSSTIADIGAGTGIFSKMLLEQGSQVICVEPNADMLCAAKRELADYPNCLYVHAMAENTTLPEQSVDFITVAQAFHWFDRSRFKTECQRILRPEGKVILIWNSRIENDALTLDNAKINKALCPNFSGFSGGSRQEPQAYADFFRDGRCEH
ncbi:class I SAM-dependent methyltransferase [Eubacteriales bacterium OttesenSCG-928-N14]|nr:class I SAM-dependent methyltransferase [Eubacteriales bacterium OttesenSCG-928-N14]